MNSDYVYTTIKPHPLVSDNAEPGPEALALMRMKSKNWPDCRWAVTQCVELGSPNGGHLMFIAVGPGRDISCITNPRLGHWSYYFVGWANLETGKIQADVP